MPGKDLFLTIQRQMITVFAHGDMRDEAGGRQALVNRLGWLGSGDHMGATLGAGILATDVFMHKQGSRNVVELFGDLFTEGFAGDVALGALPLVFGQFIAMRFTSQ